MAVLPSQPGIDVSVVCNRAALKEYEDDEDAPNDTVITKYVESISGAEFGVCCTTRQPWPKYTILFELWLDQKNTAGKFAQQKDFNTPSYRFTIEGATSKVNDDNKAGHMEANIMQDIQRMGEITVKAYFVKNLRPAVRVDYALQNKIKEVGSLPEKALKDALKSLLLIPRSPSPVPLEDRDVDTLGPEELRELVRRQRVRSLLFRCLTSDIINTTQVRDAASRTVKQEASVKRERTDERSSALPDNTDDDDEPSVVSTKRRRETYPATTNKEGMEEIDLT
ncbi:hypothetical protein N0V95_007705 [Ascochyta clinopodiicola]|nr:hypothetical protein N0V95_007705 [Ascochyta clinopodiicola]